MDREMLETLLERAATLIKTSSYTVGFTGAGISHESGVPTFRGPDGLWSRYDPKVLEIDFFFRHSKESWEAIREMFFSVDHPPEPNPAHVLLARMEAQGLLHAVITMNIDNLHHRAGSRNVIEYHGNTREAVCTLCRRRYTAREVFEMEAPPPVRAEVSSNRTSSSSARRSRPRPTPEASMKPARPSASS
nr:Sir2 family NAD-dependent protein deacetylase [Spirochaeta thermophila]